MFGPSRNGSGLYWSVVTVSTAGLGDFVIESEGLRSTLPYHLPGFPSSFSRWAAYVDPIFHIYFIINFTVLGAAINAAVDVFTFDLPTSQSSLVEKEQRDAAIEKMKSAPPLL